MVLKKPSERGVAQALLFGMVGEIEFAIQGVAQKTAGLAKQILVARGAQVLSQRKRVHVRENLHGFGGDDGAEAKKLVTSEVTSIGEQIGQV